MDRAPSLLKIPTPPRLQKLKDAARNYPCAHCNRSDGTIVPAHCNELALGRGIGFKTQDFLIAYLCHECHDNHEGRRGNLTREERRALWCRAYTVTVAWWFKDGLVKVA
jgi:hypothetical protein